MQEQSLTPATLASILRGAKGRLRALNGSGDIVRRGGAFGDLTDDTETRADQEVGRYMGDAFASLPGIARVTVEGVPEDRVLAEEGWWVTVDPVDGSLNQRIAQAQQTRHGATIGEPYMAVATVLSRYQGATFGDVIMAGMIDLRHVSNDFWNDLWLAWVDESGVVHAVLNSIPMQTAMDEKIDLGHQVVMAETYYPTNRAAVALLFAEEKGNLSRHGSAAYEMTRVASGAATLFLCDSQKQHELGAGALLVRGAGGVAMDWEGRDLGSQPYTFRAQTPTILAANQSIAADILRRIRARLRQ